MEDTHKMARIKLRRDTLANWDNFNPVLDLGEPGYVTDTEQLKIGNGVDDWTTLPYFFGGFDGGTISNPLTITANATDTDGSLQLTGDLYSGPGYVGLLEVGPSLNFLDTNIIASFVANVDDYAQVIVSNKNVGQSASSDFVVNNDSVFGGTIYGNLGINSTTFVGTGGPFDQPSSTYVLAAGGEMAVGTIDPYTVVLASNDVSRIEIANNGEVEFQPSANVHILNTTDAVNHETGALVIEGGLGVAKTIVCDDNIYIGQEAVAVPLTDPVLVAKQSGVGFIQAALIQGNDDASADFVVYTESSTESEGFADIGFCGATFNDPAYTITNPGDGYVFVQGLDDPASGGTLVLATGEYGNEKDIVFATDGFLSANERMRLSHADQTLHITMTTASTNSASGALVVDGGIGVDGNLSVGQTINGVEVTPTGGVAVLTLADGITLEHPESLEFPTGAGSLGAVLSTDGAGVLSWAAQSDLQITVLPLVALSGVNHTATSVNNIICMDPAGAARTVTLPHTAVQGKIYTIKNVGSGFNVIVDTDNVFCTIDGAGSYSLAANEAVTVVMGNDGANDVYWIIGKAV